MDNYLCLISGEYGIMNNSRIYFMEKIDTVVLQGDLFIMSFDGEERSYYGWNQVVEKGGNYKSVLVLSYNRSLLLKKKELINSFQENDWEILEVPREQIQFVQSLNKIESLANANSITIDISCLRIPHFFLLMKYLKMIYPNKKVNIINTIPYDYIFGGEPFVSYKSYLGDLELCEIIGFGGVTDFTQEGDLFIFLGFEGALSLKVVEETVYKNLFLVNTMPSYYQKYKDISVINNYNLLTSKNNRILYAPAGNPFEVYNILDREIKDNQPVCIAPLCTKPIALGICMYALEHSNVRIVYPVSDTYNDIKSRDVHLSYVYGIDL